MTGNKYSSDRKPNIGIVGAGFSGICAAIQIRKQLKLDSFTLLEQNEDVGGTWLKNTYPGCECDIRSHLYSYSFEPNPNWSHNFSPQPEIWNYLKSTAEKHNIYSHVKFNTFVKKLTWDEHRFQWIAVTVDNTIKNATENEILFDIMILCPGGLRVPNIPQEFLAFKGPSMHCGQWKHEISLENKKVAVIGSGASAIQIIPNIAEKVKELHSYQRKPAYVAPREQYRFPEFVKTLFTFVPFLMWLFRCFIFLRNEFFHRIFIPNTFFHNAAAKQTVYWREKQIPNNQKLQRDLQPKYTYGCKRILVSELYYPAMAFPHVQLHTSHIDKIVGRTIYTKDGHSEEIDVLILATGYRVQDYFSPMQIIVKDGQDLLNSWKTFGPKSYYGTTGSSTPNCFYIMGPNTALGHNSVVFQIECQTNLIMKLIKEMMQRNARYINVKISAENEFSETLKKNMKKTVWGTSDCGSWYADARGEITTIWPESCIQFWKQIRNVDFSKFDFQ